MKALGTVGKALVSPLWALGSALMPRTPKLPAPIGTPTRDDARDAIAGEDRLRRRRGGAADILTGASGAEASGGVVVRDTLGS